MASSSSFTDFASNQDAVPYNARAHACIHTCSIVSFDLTSFQFRWCISIGIVTCVPRGALNTKRTNLYNVCVCVHRTIARFDFNEEYVRLSAKISVPSVENWRKTVLRPDGERIFSQKWSETSRQRATGCVWARARRSYCGFSVDSSTFSRE